MSLNFVNLKCNDNAKISVEQLNSKLSYIGIYALPLFLSDP